MFTRWFLARAATARVLVFVILAFTAALIDAAPPTVTDCIGLNAVNPSCRPSETACYREFFYIGGHYIPYPALAGHLVSDQLYVEKLIPNAGIKQPYPLVLFHGGGLAGNVWLQTPDNRKGWASYFLDLGYAVYIIDQTSVGRATQEDLPDYPLRIGSTTEIAEAGFTVPEKTNAYPQSQLHTQWPGVSRHTCCSENPRLVVQTKRSLHAQVHSFHHRVTKTTANIATERYHR